MWIVHFYPWTKIPAAFCALWLFPCTQIYSIQCIACWNYIHERKYVQCTVCVMHCNYIHIQKYLQWIVYCIFSRWQQYLQLIVNSNYVQKYLQWIAYFIYIHLQNICSMLCIAIISMYKNIYSVFIMYCTRNCIIIHMYTKIPPG